MDYYIPQAWVYGAAILGIVLAAFLIVRKQLKDQRGAPPIYQPKTTQEPPKEKEN